MRKKERIWVGLLLAFLACANADFMDFCTDTQEDVCGIYFEDITLTKSTTVRVPSGFSGVVLTNTTVECKVETDDFCEIEFQFEN